MAIRRERKVRIRNSAIYVASFIIIIRSRRKRMKSCYLNSCIAFFEKNKGLLICFSRKNIFQRIHQEISAHCFFLCSLNHLFGKTKQLKFLFLGRKHNNYANYPSTIDNILQKIYVHLYLPLSPFLYSIQHVLFVFGMSFFYK